MNIKVGKVEVQIKGIKFFEYYLIKKSDFEDMEVIVTRKKLEELN